MPTMLYNVLVSRIIIYIIIWVSLYVLFVRCLSPPKPAGLDPPKFLQADSKLGVEGRRHNFFLISRKILNFFEFFFVKCFWVNFFHEIAERSVAISELK
jgi:hypothetical protein